MRLLGATADRKQAQIFADFLLAEGIPTRILDHDNLWEVWVQNEDQTERGRSLWQEFQANPTDPRVHEAISKAATIKKQEAEAERKWQQNFATTRHIWGRPEPKQIPVTLAVIAICIAVFLFTNMGSLSSPNLRWFTFTDPHRFANPRELARLERIFPDDVPAEEIFEDVGQIYVYTGTNRIKQGEVWRVITPIFLHFGIIHLAFNMYVFFGLGGLVEYRRGRIWFIVFILSAGAFSNVAQFAFPGLFDLQAWMGDEEFRMGVFGGMSGVLYALFGYLWLKTVYAPEPGLYLPRNMILMLVIWLFICMTGAVGNIANTAHVAGLLFGAAAGGGPKLLRTLIHHRKR